MAGPVTLAAIDAGSNAIRLSIVRAINSYSFRVLEALRIPVRLGHSVFTKRRFEENTLLEAVEAFRAFRSLMDHHGVERVRAVATAAAREARNRKSLVEWVFGETEILLEVIDDAEEARLVRSAVESALGDALAPQIIFDLGGGSLEMSLLNQSRSTGRIALPIGTVRLMEIFNISGCIRRSDQRKLKSHLLSLLESRFPRGQEYSRSLVVACGGNAEALARIAPGTRVGGVVSMDLTLLQDRLEKILERDVEARMDTYHVRRDRAEVMGIAAIVFATLGEVMRVPSMLVPGVGVRDGILQDLAREHFSREMLLDERLADSLRNSFRSLASRFGADAKHAEQVTKISLLIFDQLRSLHGLGSQDRLALELAALTHDIGHFVNHRLHHRHGAYLLRHSTIPGIDKRLQSFIACLVFYHRKHVPDRDDEFYMSFSPMERRKIRLLAGILQLCEGLESNHREDVQDVRVEIDDRKVFFFLRSGKNIDPLLREAEVRGKLLEREVGMRFRYKSKSR